MEMISKICQFCSQPFLAPLREHKRGQAKFCSRSCVGKYYRREEYKKNVNNCICSFCGKEFYRNNSSQKQSKSGFQFCSKQCKGSAQRIGSGFETMLPSHYGAARGEESNNYRNKARCHLEQKCNKCNWSLYVEVLEVHHIDHNNKNNTLSNLELLCPTCHEVYHYQTKTGKYAPKKRNLVAGG